MRNWMSFGLILVASTAAQAQPAQSGPRPGDRGDNVQPPPRGPGFRPDGARPDGPPDGRGGPEHRPGGPPPWVAGPERDVMWIGLFRPDLQQRLLDLRRSPDQFPSLVERLRGRMSQVIPALLDDLEKEVSAAEQLMGPGNLQASPEGPARNQPQRGNRPPMETGAGMNRPGPGPGAEPDGHRPNGPPPGEPGDRGGPGRMGQGPPGGFEAGRGDGRPRPNESPEVEKMRARHAELDQQIEALAGKAGTNSEAAAALQQALGEQFDLRNRMRQLELERVSARISELQATVKMLQEQQGRLAAQQGEHEQMKAAIIERRMKELTRPAGP